MTKPTIQPEGDSQPGGRSPAPRAGEGMLGNVLRIGGGQAVVYALNFLGAFLIPALLTPATFGIWRVFQLSLTYSPFLNLGFSHALDREATTLIATGRVGRYRRLMGVCISFSLLLPVLCAVGLLVAALLKGPSHTALVMLVVALFLPIQQLIMYSELSLLFEKKFGVSARLLVASTFLRILGMVGLGYWLGLGGVLLGFLLGNFSYLLTCYRRTVLPRPRLEFPGKSGRRLWLASIPITGISLGEILVSTIDKWTVPLLLGVEQNGYYGIAILPLSILAMVPLAMRQVAAIEMFDVYRRERSIAGARTIYTKALSTQALAFPFVAGAVIYGVPMLVTLFLPRYIQGIPPLVLHTLLVYPLLMMPITLVPLTITHREWATMRLQALFAFLPLLVVIWLPDHVERTLLLILGVHGCFWFGYGLVMLLFVQRQLGDGWLRGGRNALAVYAPWLYGCLALLAQHYILRSIGLVPSSVPYAVAGGILHTIACAPLLWVLDRRTGVLSRLVGRRWGG